MILTINLDPVEALPKLYESFSGLVRMILDAKDNVDNPETKAARDAIVANAMKLLGAAPEPAANKKKLSTREFALAALDFLKPLMKLDPQRTVDALHGLYTLEEGEKDNIAKALTAFTTSIVQEDVLTFLSSLDSLNRIDFGTSSEKPVSSISAPSA